ncbi:hypothetical protein [Allohahella sp. A8]|uniref:hypothetical protein n=1 Tax=Allohahella sp. A8 TaxID=3141461 RepID=UPI000C094556|nr:hypothetical protein [Hahellaceae bacterium]|tara:strand:- start:89882 stop:90097 length:216 start_codon:yes stop_codon:yes gene_type:complete
MTSSLIFRQLRGSIGVEYLVCLLMLVAILFTPLGDNGLPSPGGKTVGERLVESIRANHNAWVYAMSMPDAQ